MTDDPAGAERASGATVTSAMASRSRPIDIRLGRLASTPGMDAGPVLHLALGGVLENPEGQPHPGVAVSMLPAADEPPVRDARLDPRRPAAERMAALLADDDLAALAAAPQFDTAGRQVFLYRFGDHACALAGDDEPSPDGTPPATLAADMPWSEATRMLAEVQQQWRSLRPPPPEVPANAMLIGSPRIGVLLAPDPDTRDSPFALVHFQVVVDGWVIGDDGPDLVWPAVRQLEDLVQQPVPTTPQDAPRQHPWLDDPAGRFRAIMRDHRLRHQLRLDRSESLDHGTVFIESFDQQVRVLACSDSTPGVVSVTVPRHECLEIAHRVAGAWRQLTGSH